MKNNSRHPKINYWFWDEKTIKDKNYLKNIDEVTENSSFDLIMVTERGNLNFWELQFKPLFEDAVEYAHSKGIKIALQLWPRGSMMNAVYVSLQEAVAIVTEYETKPSNDGIIINAHGKNVRNPEITTPIKSELIFAAAFDKKGDGFYDKKSFELITDKAKITDSEDREALEITFDRGVASDKTIYAMVAHYYSYGDLFSDFYINEYKNIIDYYKDIPFDGFGLDEFRNIAINPFWYVTDDTFRERVYGKHFHKYFEEKTGESLIDTMFNMRWCPENEDAVRIKAINTYFDIFRHSTVRIEKFIADYALKTFGEDIFIGVHNTFHNNLENDEIWHTGCNWWEIPRKYAQTDEDITYPVRMGLACTCPENIVYDMFYHPDKEVFYEKAVRDARFNTRIHYHAINDGSEWGVDTGKKEFLQIAEKIESKITLLNIFDPVLPKMELLAVFGFPALCNWYPDFDARNKFDLNGKLQIMEIAEALWEAGYLNALAPSDAIVDGRITMNNGKYIYGGHTFDKLLFMYPQYSKPETCEFIKKAAGNGYEIKILGEYTHGFDGEKSSLGIGDEFFITYPDTIAEALKLSENPIHDGCILEDGSVVISNYDSVMNDRFCTYTFRLGSWEYKAVFRGTFAIKVNEAGDVERLVAGNLRELLRNGETLISLSGDEDYIKV